MCNGFPFSINIFSCKYIHMLDIDLRFGISTSLTKKTRKRSGTPNFKQTKKIVSIFYCFSFFTIKCNKKCSVYINCMYVFNKKYYFLTLVC